ncbi:S8 family peptidase [Streptomyces sp. NBC_01262]|uniref:S8 family peptidase n=1 Tax=Streptomyces sp. NBC_01262 TaxID=2903803 RepID=UPI002E33F762|nr:S8 family serine peptidase [Streptomyces sp. NBC_01262]
MHVRRHAKRARSAAVATVVAAALTAGAVAPATAESGQPGQREQSAPGLQVTDLEEGGAARGTVRVTLVTGDKVAVNARGEAVGIDPAAGRERIPVQVKRVGGHVYVVPLDAARLIGEGTVDRRLFDVTTLSRPEYVDAARDGLGLIVTYKGTRPAARAQVHAAGDTEVVRTFKRINAEAVTAPERDTGRVWDAVTSAPQGGSASREAAPGIRKVWLDGINKATLDKSVPQIGAPAAWAAGYDGKGVKVAVLDSGVDQTHPDLAGQEIAEKNFSDAATMADKVGHGTHVASTIAGTGAKYRGVATGARILDGKVLNDVGEGEDSGIIAAMEWAVAEGARVVNLSLGSTDTPGIDPVEETVNRLSAEKGTLFVVAAGNEGEAGASTVDSPGSADAALTVGAVDKSDELAEFSSRGPRVGDGAIKPDLTAPGVDITAASAPGSLIAAEDPSPAPGYVTISGTSMATPHVAGAAAILAQEHPDWSGDRLKAALTASTVPGAYTVFEQGSGRVDVAAAIKQTVIADATALNFGTQLWPHTDDQPVRRTLTYRNLGAQDITLDLTATFKGPDGRAAPAGLFTLDRTRLTIPAGGAAEATATVNTKLGTLDGSYSGYVVATGGGQSVRTPAATEREVQSYTLTVKHLGRDGKPTAKYETALGGLTGLAAGTGQWIHDDSGTVTLRVPKGRYALDSSLYAGSAENVTGLDWIVRPNLSISKNTTVTVDARTAKAVSVTVPDSRATERFAETQYQLDVGGNSVANYWRLTGFKILRVAHLGPQAKAGELHQQFMSTWAHGSTEYNLAYGSSARTLATGFTKHAKAGELAKVSVRLGSSAGNKRGTLIFMPVTAGDVIGYGWAAEVKLPATRTVYLSTTGVKWSTAFSQISPTAAPDSEPEASYWRDDQKFKAGRTYKRSFNVGVFGPKVGGRYGLYRDGDQIWAILPLLADGASNTGISAPYDRATTTLFRNGVKVGTVPNAADESAQFTVPGGKADYRLSTSLTRSKVATVSTKVSATWTFSSKKASTSARLPASVVRFTPALSATSTSRAGATTTVPVTVQGAGAGGNLKSLTVYVSFDGGAHWKKLTVRSGKVKVKNPKAGKGVSFKAKVTDKKGNTLTQTIVNAYRTK